MPVLKRIEKTLLGWHKTVPHLSEDTRVWTAENAWRIVVIGIGFSLYSLFALIPTIITTMVLTPAVSIVGFIGPNIPYYQATEGWPWIALLGVAIVFFATAIILATAVYPLIEMKKRGWDLTFRACVLNFAMGVVTTLLFPSLLELAALIVITLVAGYLLLEIRREFHAAKSDVKVKQ